MNLIVNQDIVDSLTPQQISQLIWLDGSTYYTNKNHLDFIESLGVDIPKPLRDLYDSEGNPANQDLLVVQDPSSQQFIYDDTLGMFMFTHPVAKRLVSIETFQDGFGTNSNSTADPMRRYNGSAQDSTRGMAYPFTIMITSVCCTVSIPAPRSGLRALLYDIDGKNGVDLGTVPFLVANNKVASTGTNLSVVIPAFRRLVMTVGGDPISYPQGFYHYRVVK